MSFNILVAEDYRETRELITEVLQNNPEYKVVSAENGEEALRKFYELGPFDLVISDIKMPGVNGMELLSNVQQNNPDLPVVLVTGFGDDYGARALELGAEDCIFKPFNTNELMLRVARVLKYSKLRQMKDILMMKNEELRKMAITDGLSQLYNRRYFLELLEREFPRAQRYNLNLSCIMMDIDHFKVVNDQYGHLQGDFVIQRLGIIIKNEIREIDIPARYGGEEFILMLPETDERGTLAVAERLRKRTEGENFTRNEKLRETQVLHITISLGVAVFPQPKVIHPNDLIKCADEALYEAKRAGRNCSVLSNPTN
jgi:diguanylate cyclase (GGDEF)-like protein